MYNLEPLNANSAVPYRPRFDQSVSIVSGDIKEKGLAVYDRATWRRISSRQASTPHKCGKKMKWNIHSILPTTTRRLSLPVVGVTVIEWRVYLYR